MKEQVRDALRHKRRERAETFEDQVHGLFRAEELPIDVRAEQGLNLIADKMLLDLDEQFQHVTELSEPGTASNDYVDQEISRLLRMLEKRRGTMESLERTLEVAGRLVIE